MENKILSLIGMCKRAGKLVTGEQAVLDSVKKSSLLVIIANDSSEGTKKKLTDKCKTYNVKYIIFSDKVTLGTYTKKEYAASVSINDINFAKQIEKLYLEYFS